MFGKILVGLAALLVIGVGGYMYFGSECSNHTPGTCSSQAGPTACSVSDETPSCCASASRVAACCEAGESASACEELAVMPRETK
jgi:hypothetical protein